MKEFRFGYADGYISSPYNLSDEPLPLRGTRRGLERPDKVFVNFSKATKLTEQETQNLYFAQVALKLNNHGVIYEN